MVYSAEIERVLRGHPAIEDIAAVGFKDDTWGEVGYASVILKPSTDVSPEDVIG